MATRGLHMSEFSFE